MRGEARCPKNALSRFAAGTATTAALLLVLIAIAFPPPAVMAQAPGWATPALPDIPYNSIMEVINDPANGMSNVVRLVVESAGLSQTLSDPSLGVTAFIPTDDAILEFASRQGSPEDFFMSLMSNAVESLRRLVLYHILPVSVNTNALLLRNATSTWPTLLSAEYIQPPAFTMLTMDKGGGGSDSSSIRLIGTDGSTAIIVTPDKAVNNGRSYVHTISAILPYWYKDLDTVFNRYGLTTYQALLNGVVVVLSTWPQQSRVQIFSNEIRTYLAPNDDAIKDFGDTSGLKYSDTDSATQIVLYHVLKQISDDLPQANSSSRLATLLERNTTYDVTLQTTVTTGNNRSVASRFVGIGNSANVDMTLGRIQVGGPVPSSYVYVLDTVLLPSYSTVWQYLEAAQGQAPGFKLFNALLIAEGTILESTLRNINARVTLLAPTDGGIQKFLKAFNISNVDELSKSPDLQKILKMHIITQPMPRLNFIGNQNLSTLLGRPISSYTDGTGSITLTAGRTNATVVSSNASDMRILFGRSYIQSIDYLLIPNGITLRGSRVMDVIRDRPDLTTALALVEKLGLSANFSDPNFQGTIFLPDDAAFGRFADTQGLSGVAALLALESKALRRLLMYHILPVSVNTSALASASKPWPTLLSAEYASPLGYTTLTTTASDSSGVAASIRIQGTEGSIATLITPDVPINKARSYIHVISEVLPYWYRDMDTALDKNGLTVYKFWLKNFDRPAVQLAFFAPTNDAIRSFEESYRLSYSDTGTMTQIISYHATRNTSDDFTQAPKNTTQQLQTLLTRQNISEALISLQSKVTLGNSSLTVQVSGVGSNATVDVARGRIPVGGVVPSSYIYVIDSVLLPVYANIWQYLTAAQNQTPGFKLLNAMLAADGTVLESTLKDPLSQVTFLAPTDNGVKKFLNRYNYSNVDELMLRRPELQKILQTHVFTPPKTTSSTGNNSAFETLLGNITSALNVVWNGSVTFYADRTNATIVPDVKDISILFGRSYVQGIDFLLIPSGVTLRGDEVMDIIRDSANNLNVALAMVEKLGLSANLYNPNFNGTFLLPNDEAFERFAVTQGLSGASALLNVETEALRRMVLYHVLPVSVNTAALGAASQPWLTMLSTSYPIPPSYTKLKTMSSGRNGTSTILVEGTDGTTATLVTSNIAVNKGRSYVHIISAVLPYWERDLDSALGRRYGLTYYKLLLNIANGALTSLRAEGVELISNQSRVYLAPTDDAIYYFGGRYRMDFGDTDNAVLIFLYHVSMPPSFDITLGNVTAPLQTFLPRNGEVYFQTTVTGNNSVASYVHGVGSTATVNLTHGRIPVGGIVPSSYVYVLDSVLIPVFASIWQFLDAATLKQSPGFKLLKLMLAAEGTVLETTLKDPRTSVTFLAPTDDGINAFLKQYNYSSFDEILARKSDLQKILKSHILTQPMAMRNFSGQQIFQTQLGKSITSATNVISSGSVTLNAGRTEATIMPNTTDIPILFGRSYVQTVNSLLVPDGIQLPNDPSSAMMAYPPAPGQLVIVAASAPSAQDDSKGPDVVTIVSAVIGSVTAVASAVAGVWYACRTQTRNRSKRFHHGELFGGVEVPQNIDALVGGASRSPNVIIRNETLYDSGRPLAPEEWSGDDSVYTAASNHGESLRCNGSVGADSCDCSGGAATLDEDC